MSVRILVGHDGSCPHVKRGVVPEGARTFRILPDIDLREPLPGGARMNVRLKNTGSRRYRVAVTVDWQGSHRAVNYDMGFVRHRDEQEWTQVKGHRRRNIVRFNLSVRPGLTEFGLYPAYNYRTYCTFMRRLEKSGAQVKRLAMSREKREVWLATFPALTKNARHFVVQARDHAYETAGSFCIEGIATFLASDDPVARFLRSKFTVVLIPMTNPDGVYNGFTRFTRENGTDMNRMITRPDPVHRALKRRIDALRPFVHLNLHNWQKKNLDGLLCYHTDTARRFEELLPADQAHEKKWLVETIQDYLTARKLTAIPETAKSWKDYCTETFDGEGMVLEFPWYQRTTADMRQKGADAFKAMALAVIEKHGL